MAFCKIQTTKINSTKENIQNLNMLLYFGKNKNNPNNMVLIEIKVIPISGKEPPYSFRIVLKKET
ncbi:hypothetical protein FPN186_contig00058-0066 [Flavobacterium psychrophilum]|nr:hypothetical protein FPN181_contig00008-0066 [Flavobacterium psychrophilum]GEJ40074.1 hypothetical protein FPN182_contig00038-0004 [Flavobacterium psychrophilum]GEJ42624.1 hypothetical protein FPN186_contig00058-0066 [Flavobacterium psychrophilum]GEJ51762.1 hypothetical protein FPKKO176_contig00037-0059 [Flavobacterium psychrophilum]GEJ52874.1 hypothetical protein FPKHI175_contig00001-0004 [Flavobacterium psychrophilum]